MVMVGVGSARPAGARCARCAGREMGTADERSEMPRSAVCSDLRRRLTLMPGKYRPTLRPFLMHTARRYELTGVERSSIHAFLL